MTDSSTLLVLSGVGVPPYSARGLSQTLQPIQAAASLARTVNGELIDLSESQFRKYKSAITCTDLDAPALAGIWPGMQVTVDSVAELAVPLDTDNDVSGGPATVDGRTVLAWRTDGDFGFYMPRLVMRVTDFQETKDEWGATTAWELDLEEI